MAEDIKFNGIIYASLQSAAQETGLSRDYISRLCRKKMLDARREEDGWYVTVDSIKAYIRAQEHANEFRRKELAKQRATEYEIKRMSQAQKVFAVALAAESEALPKTFANMGERMRLVLEPKSGTTLSSLSESARAPGLLQAAAHLPAQALAHMPTHAISPAMDLLHRVIALTTAFVLVFGTYSAFNPVFARMVYDSAQQGAVAAVHFASNTGTEIVKTAEGANVALANFSRDPALVMSRVDDLAAASYGTVAVLASRITPHRSPVPMTASAAAATPQATPADVEPVAPVAPAAAVTADNEAQLAAAATPESDSKNSEPVGFTQPIAIAVKFSGSTVAYGDIVSYDPVTKIYSLARVADDANAYGVVIEDPALVFKPDEESNISVARSGPALTNVTLENGPIAAGDLLTTSSIPGKARRAKDGEHVIGTAAEPFAGGGITLQAPDGSSLESGTIKANVTVGATAPGAAAQEQNCSSLSCRLTGSLDMQVVRALVRYLLSGIIAALTLTLAFKSFMSDANYGVISMGRNPRAKSSIQSMVVFNAVLTLAIASAGLFAAMIVLFAG